MWTGSRIVRDEFSSPRWIDWRIQSVAYVENLKPRRQSNFSAARIRPSMPSCTRSPSDRPWPWYLRATDTTSRRFELIIRSFAAMSPFSMRLASSISSTAVSSGYLRAALKNSWSESVVTSSAWACACIAASCSTSSGRVISAFLGARFFALVAGALGARFGASVCSAPRLRRDEAATVGRRSFFACCLVAAWAAVDDCFLSVFSSLLGGIGEVSLVDFDSSKPVEVYHRHPTYVCRSARP